MRLLKLRLPPQALVVRLDDAGMSVQMAEYVCHAVIRHFREFDGYEADVKAGKWSYRKPRSRAEYPIGVMGLGVLGSRVAQALRLFEFPVNGWSRTPQFSRRRARLRWRGPVRRVPVGEPGAGQPAAADAGHARHPVP